MSIVTETVTAYQRRHAGDHHPIDITALDLPPRTFQTQAIWFEPGDLLADEFPFELLMGSLHATEHAQIAVLPLIAMCDRWDIGGLSTNAHPQTGGPTIFIHEAHPGGVGIARQAFREFESLVSDAHRLIGECPCEKGCPSCIQSPKCGNLNEPLSKPGALELLRRMLQPEDFRPATPYHPPLAWVHNKPCRETAGANAGRSLTASTTTAQSSSGPSPARRWA